MKVLPKNITVRVLFASIFLVVFLVTFPSAALAASAYVSPATGLITNQNFKVSFYVESTATEPEIAGAELIISYPKTVSVVSINNGEFDSYIEKANDPATGQVTINALNNAGTYKTGKVKVASINFEAKEASGEVQLTISSSSGISGAGGEQLLTETINGVYTLEVADLATIETPTEGTGGDATGAPVVEEPPVVPETGTNSILLFALISSGLIGLGLLSLSWPTSKNELN